MNRLNHELVLHDSLGGRPEVAIRTGCPTPNTKAYTEAEIRYQETRLPPDVSDMLMHFLAMHEECLARDIGRRWLEENR